tara:strand:+ start:905 stop:2191 length:1287 start_codon:yes stop_codon:yes gene_type:complete
MLMIDKYIFKYKSQDDGAVLPIVALMLPVILGMTALGVDTGYWLMHQRDLQSAADAAAMAAAYEYANGFSENMDFAATKEATQNGFDVTDGDVLTLTTDETGDNPIISVTISFEDDAWFSRRFISSHSAQVSAAALVGSSSGNYCMLSLNEEDDGALSASGSVTINATQCGMATNSDSDDAMEFTGSVEVNVASLRMRGGYRETGSVELNVSDIQTHAGKIKDPYEDLDIPIAGSCSKNDMKNNTKITGSGSTTLSPGTYCGGIEISGSGAVNFEPGVYILDGGDFDLSGSGQITGDGVSFILTNSGEGDYGNIDITGSNEINFSAPEEGEEMEGVVFYQDRNAPAANGSSGENKITGSNQIILDGTVYTPSRELRMGGSSSAMSENTAPCTRLIADTITLSGSPAIGNNCDDSAAKNIGTPNVRLYY